jgi:chromosomal replication initiator protein
VLAEAISQRIGEPRYQLWFAEKTKLAWSEEQLVIGVPNLFLQDWLEQKFGAEVRAAVKEAMGAAAGVRFVIDPELFQSARRLESVPASSAGNTPPPALEAKRPSRQRRWRQMIDFVVGPCNRVAHASALSIIETPEECPIPLVLHGGVGVGKTHLLEGVCAALRHRYPDWKVLFLTAEDFTNRFVQAMHQQKLGAFRKSFRDCDALLIDDIGFLAKKQATQEEFLHTIDALQSEHRVVMATTDCHPRLADHFMPELTDRLVGGAVWSMTPPDGTTRADLLRFKAVKLGPIPDDVLTFLADHLRGNVRELEGALHSVLHVAKVHARPLDIDMARETLGDLLRHSTRQVGLDEVERAVCTALGVSRELLFSNKRNWIYSYPRMVAMYLARIHTGASCSEVGKHFGGRNHSTVVAAEKKVRAWLQTNLSMQLGKRTMPIRDIIERIERVLEA